jgi:hypothetical protein
MNRDKNRKDETKRGSRKNENPPEQSMLAHPFLLLQSKIGPFLLPSATAAAYSTATAASRISCIDFSP